MFFLSYRNGDSMQFYEESDLVRIAKRENNKKRNYLVVNRLQGKHIPVEPEQALAMFGALADTLKASCAGKNILVIGFAETATAIGAAVAARLGAYYLQTTREDVEGAEYLFFSEEHSHATEQRLVKNDLDTVMFRIDRVVFAEDEITTGNTILNIINRMEKEYPGQAEYAAASILNGMDREASAVFESQNIGLFYLARTDHRTYAACLQQYSQRGSYLSFMPGEMDQSSAVWDANGALLEEFEIEGWMDARRLVSAAEYEKACSKLWEETDKRLHGKLTGRILVLGTEEFMYPALLAADFIARTGARTWFHATTRSPIEVFQEKQYPLHVRYALPSLYDKNRKTFLYDIGAYDAAVVMTDAHSKEREGLRALVQAVAMKNKKIYVIRWC